MIEQPCLREKQIHYNIAEGRSVSSPVQFIFDAEDVFSHVVELFCGFGPVLLLYLVHLAYPQQQGLSWRRLSSS